ncbi:acetyltransferase [Aerococcaceae bacterium DSM 111176]|nr:acetyltransferase [Aerococcaceae bacterium DSM 111176]
MSDTLVMLGAGGHAKVCYDIALAMEQWHEVIILDDNQENDYFTISGPISDYINYDDADFFIAIGSNEVRKKFILDLIAQNLSIATLIHPSVIIGSKVQIGQGSVLMPGVIVNAKTQIGQGCIINTATTIDHDCQIDDYVHLSPGVHLSGTVSIGESSWIGTGTSVINNINITSQVIIGAGATVINDINHVGTYVGVPIEKVK